MARPVEQEVLISWTLRIGVYLAGLIICAGLAMLFITGNSGYPEGDFPNRIQEVWTGARTLKPAAITSLGLILLILTPVIRVAASLLLFAVEGDRLYTLITLVVLGILLFSLLFGHAL